MEKHWFQFPHLVLALNLNLENSFGTKTNFNSWYKINAPEVRNYFVVLDLHCPIWLLIVPYDLLLFSSPIVSNSLQLHGLQHTRPFCPSRSPEVWPSSCPSHWWCYPAISSSDSLFSFCPQSFPASEIFPMSWLFTSDDQNTGVSASASVLPMISLKIGWFDLLAVQGILRSLLQHHSWKASILWHSAFFMVQLLQPYMTTGKIIALTMDLCR